MADGSSLQVVDEDSRARLRAILNLEYDEVIAGILSFIISNEPTTLYRVYKQTRFSISTVYKKARKMINLRLIAQASFDGQGALYVSTVKGILACMAYRCLDDEILYERIRIKWRLGSYCAERIPQVVKALAWLLGSEDLNILDDPFLVMLMILEKASLINHEERGELREAYNTAAYYILRRLIADENSPIRRGLLLGWSNVLVDINHGNSLYVYYCGLCRDKPCSFRLIKAADLRQCPDGKCSLVDNLTRIVGRLLTPYNSINAAQMCR